MIVLMQQVIIYLALIVSGLAFGSFAGATVWRLRARQLKADKAAHEPYDHKEYSRLKKLLEKSTLNDRSQCLHCGYTLRWYDLIPLVSWLSLKGKCRNCKHSIGTFEPLIELAVAAFFVISYMFWPLGLATGFEIAHFILWLGAGVIMAVLFAYDQRWYLLPDRYSVALAIVGAAMVAMVAIPATQPLVVVVSALGAVAALGGLYGLLYVISRGRWVGFGDVKLGVGLGLLLADWQLALVALFMANFIGCLIVIPLLIGKKIKRDSRIPFGPLLILGAIIAWFIGRQLLAWYLGGMGLY